MKKLTWTVSSILSSSWILDLKRIRSNVSHIDGYKRLTKCLILFLSCILTGQVYGSTIQVTNTNTSGAGSFDQAMQDFIAGGTSGTISFDPSLSGSTIIITTAYSLSSNTLTLDGDVNSDGVGDITLQSDGNSHRLFDVSGTATVTINNLTVSDFTFGNGGVISISSETAALNINNTTLNDNSSTDGGVIYLSSGNVAIKKSIFNGNSASGSGGVIYFLTFSNSSALDIESSVFTQNTAASEGGVIYKDFIANATLRHVTFANNAATGGRGGAIRNSGGTLRVENSLFVGNSSSFGSADVDGGIDNAGGNIFAGASSNASDYFVDPTNGDYSLSSTSPAVNAGVNALTTTANITTDIVGNPVPYDGIADIVDVGAYEFQGDPPIKFESSAVISSSTLTVTLTFNREVTGLANSDFSSQTGDLSLSSLTSPDNIEYTATFNLSDLTEKVIDTVYMDALVEDMFMNNLQAKDTFAFVFYVPLVSVTNTATSGEGSLDQALQDFIDSQGTVNTVEFDASLNGSTIMVTQSYSFSQGTLTIDGDIDDDGAFDVTLQSDGANHGLFLINGSTSLNLSRLQIIDFSPNSQWGPVVQVNSGVASLSVEGCEIQNISTGGFGGAVYCENGSVSIKESIFDDCTANWGGAVTIYGGATTIENSLFINNSASNGGAIYGRNGANISVTHCTFSENSATSAGGAIYNLRNLTVGNSLFVDNTVNSTVSNIRNDATFTDNGGNIYGGESSTSNDVADYFADAVNDDYTLHLRSLAADQGLNALATNAGIADDLLGNPRPFVGAVQTVDVGAYELQADPDFVDPTVSIATTSTDPTNDNPIPVTITFNESVTGFESTDITLSGGTLDNFTGSGTSYAFDLVPDADGTLTVDVAASVAVDVAGNGNTVASQLSIDYDGTAPTVSLATTALSPTNSTSIPVTITFSEAVTGFESADITISGGSITNFTGSGADYAFDLVPDADGALNVDIEANAAIDVASNGNTAATQLSVDYDGTAPTVSMATTASSPTNSNPMPVTITFGEPVTGFESADITISGGSMTNFTGSGADYSFDLVPEADGTLTVDIAANVAIDVADNGNTAATQLSVDYDGTAPTVSMATTALSPTKSASIPVTITFSEAVTGFESADITISDGFITNFTGSGTDYAFDLVPDADGELTVDIAANVAIDVASNGNTAATQLSVDYDGTAPAVSIATTASSPTNSNPIPVTITFNEPVTGFESADITISGGSITNFTGSGADYAFDLVPDADGALTVDIAADVAIDVVGNGNTAATQLSVDYDDTAPAVSIATTVSLPTNSNPIPVTIAFSEPVTGFESADITISGGSITNFTGSGADYAFDLVPDADGALTVNIAANIAIDAAGNANTAATQLSAEYDGTAPVVSIDVLSTTDQTPELTGTIDDLEAMVSVMVDGQTVEATNNGDGTWVLADNTLTELLVDIYEVTVTATDLASNIGSDATSNELTIAAITALTGEEDLSISVYPNPTTSRLTIETKGYQRKIHYVEVLSTNGARISASYAHRQMDVSHLVSGSYYLLIHFTDHVIVKKFKKN